MAEVCACVNRVVECWRAVQDSQEQWYAVGGVKSSSEDSASASEVRFLSIVEERKVEYVPVSVPSISAPGPSSLCVSSGKSKERKVSRSPVKLPRPSHKHPVVEDLGFVVPLDRQQYRGKSRRSGRNWNIAPVFQGGLQ